MFGVTVPSPSKYFTRYRDNIKYASLHDGSPSSSDDGIIDDKEAFPRTGPKYTARLWIVLILLATNFASFAALLYTNYPLKRGSPEASTYVPNSYGKRNTHLDMSLTDTYI
jgi:hypothetical protein